MIRLLSNEETPDCRKVVEGFKSGIRLGGTRTRKAILAFLRHLTSPSAIQRCIPLGLRPPVKEPVGSRSSPARENRISPTAMDRSHCGQGSDLERHSASKDTYIAGLCLGVGTL